MSMEVNGFRQDQILRDITAAETAESRSTPVSQGLVVWPIWWPLSAAVLLSILIRVLNFDLFVADLCYDHQNQVWPFDTAQPWLWFYRNGTLPPLIIGIAGAVAFLCGHWIFRSHPQEQANRLRRSGLFLALLMLIGPGLLVNSSLKMTWGRPRPWQCEQFGGELKFLPVGEWGSHNLPNSSFPSGHAAVAFFLIGLAFIISPRQPHLQMACFVGGVIYGLAMGITRVMQGGHFPSDVLWAGVIVYIVAAGLSRLMFTHD